MRLIDADALKAKYEQMIPEIGDGYHKETLQDCLFELEYAPTVSPDEVRGVWIEDRMDYKCSACGKAVKDEIVYMLDPYQLPPFCPNCGARMEVSEDA